MGTLDYTTVVGVDRKHLEQLALTWPTWKRHKPGLLERPILVFRDASQVREASVREVVDHPDLTVVAWPPIHADNYHGVSADGKFGNAQRYKMIAGFVHVPAAFVTTKWWLKLDTDTVATGMDDWIDPSWFESERETVIAAQSWGFTKPPNQMIELDDWIRKNLSYNPKFFLLDASPPLNLFPKDGWSRVRHKRIISWCGFFRTDFTQWCSDLAESSCGRGKLPVPSQDGYMWYMATRARLEVVRCGMKSRGWQHWSTMENIGRASKEAMDNGKQDTSA